MKRNLVVTFLFWFSEHAETEVLLSKNDKNRRETWRTALNFSKYVLQGNICMNYNTLKNIPIDCSFQYTVCNFLRLPFYVY